jgi:cysteine sulfinate desulfinase/cysteine desulfurase-like protein
VTVLYWAKRRSEWSGFLRVGAVSAGSACSSGKVRPSHVVTAMGFGADRAATALRVSLGPTNTEADIEAFITAWKKIHAVPAMRQIQPAA